MTLGGLGAVPRRAAEGAPNVLFIVFDDLGFAQLGCYGSEIASPSIDRLAAAGLRYNRFHVTPLCSPTRAALLTGRNHHAVGMGFLADLPLDQPGYCAHRPTEAGTLPRILTDAGYSTYAVGKWHLTPTGERSPAGPFTMWPLGWGFEQYYGFLQGDTNQWTPNLVRDNHYIDPPRSYEDGYHLSEDLADQAIRYLQDQHHACPDKPFFMYFALGAMHAPHHVGTEWVEPYHGRFDDGWDALRQRVFARQLADGLIPAGTVLTEHPDWVPQWDELTDDDRRLYARMHETYAGFLTHSDAQIGRVIDHLDRAGQLDNTIVVVLSDNGASAEGGVRGTSNEHRFTHHIEESTEANLRFVDDWGGPRTYSHYAWGWAWAGNTPFHLWKRYTWLGGTRSPLIVHWPRVIDDGGAVRDQMCHVVDLMPTVLSACGVEPPSTIDGLEQQRIDGASLTDSFGDARAPSPRDVQYFEMLGSRAIISGPWKATTNHVSKGVADEERLLIGSRDFDTDEWSLFRLDDDYSEAVDVAADHPDVLAGLIELWNVEAERNNVLPIKDSLMVFGSILPRAYPPASSATYRPGASPVRDDALPRLAFGGSVSVTVEASDDPSGVLCAIGDWNGGFAIYVDRGTPCAVINTGGDEAVARSSIALSAGRHDVTCRLDVVDGFAHLGLEIDGVEVGHARSPHSIPFTWQHGGTALRLGHDAGFPVTDDYECPATWNGGLESVTVMSNMVGAIPTAAEIQAALHAD
jgi:arylsulfatase A-like enzyme